jgi:hypothetical protein
MRLVHERLAAGEDVAQEDSAPIRPAIKKTASASVLLPMSLK